MNGSLRELSLKIRMGTSSAAKIRAYQQIIRTRNTRDKFTKRNEILAKKQAGE